MKLTCLQCNESCELPEGGEILSLVCAKCGVPFVSNFSYAKTVRFEDITDPLYTKICDAARKGDVDEAVAALEKAVAQGFKDFERIDNDPVLAPMRSAPRFAALVEKHRKV